MQNFLSLWLSAGTQITHGVCVIFINDAFIALVIDFVLFMAFAHWLERLIHDNAYVALVAYTSERLSVQLILNIIALRLSRMPPKNDTFICIETHEGHLGLAWQTVHVILQTLNIRWTLQVCTSSVSITTSHERPFRQSFKPRKETVILPSPAGRHSSESLWIFENRTHSIRELLKVVLNWLHWLVVFPLMLTHTKRFHRPSDGSWPPFEPRWRSLGLWRSCGSFVILRAVSDTQSPCTLAFLKRKWDMNKVHLQGGIVAFTQWFEAIEKTRSICPIAGLRGQWWGRPWPSYDHLANRCL